MFRYQRLTSAYVGSYLKIASSILASGVTLGYYVGEFSSKTVCGHGFPLEVYLQNSEMYRNVMKMQTDSLHNGKCV